MALAAYASVSVMVLGIHAYRLLRVGAVRRIEAEPARAVPQ